MTAATKQFLKVRTVFPECVCQNISEKKKKFKQETFLFRKYKN